MIKKWEIKASPAPSFPDRKLLLMSSEGKGDAEKLKKSFAGYMGVVFASGSADFQWAAYLYEASANIEKLIEQELKATSLESASPKPSPKLEEKTETPPEKKMEFPKKAPKPAEKTPPAEAVKAEKAVEAAKPEEAEEKETKTAKAEKPSKPEVKAEAAAKPAEEPEPATAPVIEKFEKREPAKTEKTEEALAPETAPAAPIIEKFEQFTPDQSAVKPLTEPLIETFARERAEEKPAAEPAAETVSESAPVHKEAPPVRKDVKAIEVLYLCPESAKDKAEIVKENIAKIVAEKNINFDFKSAGLVLYKPGANKESVMADVAKYKFSFVLVVAPDAMGEELLREIKKKGFVPKVITEDNIDKKFRYLNLITDIVLSPRR